MPPLPSRKVLESMKRVELQKLCKDYGVRANLKSEALIDLLLDTQTAATSRRQPPASKPQSKPPSSRPPSRRIVSTRQFSRTATSRTSSMIIHDIDDEHTAHNKDIRTETDGRKPNHGGSAISGPSQPPPQPQTATTDGPRTKAKELQRRLGVGKPIGAGGAGPRTVTRSTTLSKGTQLKSSKMIEPEATIPEEENPPGPFLEPMQGNRVDNTAFTAAEAGRSDSLTKLADVDEVVANALRPLHEQFQALRAELEQMRLMKSELAQLKHEVEELKCHTSSNNVLSNPVTPKSKDSSPNKPFGYGDLGMPSSMGPSGLEESRPQSSLALDATLHQHTLGKRARDLFEAGVEESGHDKQGNEEGDWPIPKKRRTSRIDGDLNIDIADDSDYMEPARMQSRRSRAPAIKNIFQEPNDTPEGVNEQIGTTNLSDYLIIPSSPGTVSAPEYGRHDAPSTASGTADQNISTFPSPTQTPQIHPQRQSLYSIPAFPYPETPQSPTPSGTGRHAGSELDPDDEKRSDTFQSFGLPPLGRPGLRMPNTINPSELTTRQDAEIPIARNVNFGLHMIPSSSSITSVQLEGEGAPSKRVTMYGTELDGDTRFGDFGVEGVATGFWSGGRF